MRWQTFWSPDSGVRFAMIRNWVEHGDLAHLHYPALPYDPDYRVHPLSAEYPGFLVPQYARVSTIYPPLFPFLCGIGFRCLGLAGLVIVPIISGLGTVVMITLTGYRLGLRWSWLLPVLAGVATPIVLYSVVFWDHSAQFLLTASSAYLLLTALETSEPRRAFAAGAVLGLGVWFHEFFFALFGALLIAAWRVDGGVTPRRLIAAMLAGFGLLVAAWILFNAWTFGLPLGPHVMGANDISQPKLARRVLNPGWMFLQGSRQLVGSGGFSEVLLYALLAFPFLARLRGRAAVWLPVLLYAIALVALTTPQRTWAEGLFDATPLFFPVLAACWRSKRKPATVAATAATFEAWLSRAAFGFGLVILLSPLGGGIGWGNRALLTTLPWLVLLVTRASERLLCLSSGRARWVLGSGLGALVLASGYMQFIGWTALRADLEQKRQRLDQVLTLPERVAVTDDWMLWPCGVALPGASQRFLVRNRPESRRAFVRVVNGARINRFSFVGSARTAQDLLASFEAAATPFELRARGDRDLFIFERAPGG
jgi:hypothetical protein